MLQIYFHLKQFGLFFLSLLKAQSIFSFHNSIKSINMCFNRTYHCSLKRLEAEDSRWAAFPPPRTHSHSEVWSSSLSLSSWPLSSSRLASLLSCLFHFIPVILITSKAWSKHGNLESWWVGWRNRTRRWTLPENYFDHHSGRDHHYLDHHGYLRSTMMMMIIIIIVIMIVMLFMRNWLIVSHNLWQSWRWGELDFYLRNLCSLFMMILPPSSPLPTCRNQKYKSWKLIGVQDHQKPHTGR